MSDLLGLPFVDVDQARSLRMSLAARATLARIAGTPAEVPGEPAPSGLQALLVLHQQARDDLRAGKVETVSLRRPRAGRSTVYDREKLGQLERTIAEIERAITFDGRLLA